MSTTADLSVPVGDPVVARRGSERTSVTLIRPPVVVLPNSLAVHGPIPPIGLAYIAASARAAGHAVQVIDAPGQKLDQWVPYESPVGSVARIGLSLDEIVDQIDPQSRVIGLTNMFQHEWPQMRELVALIKARYPEKFIVLGGENATAFREWIFEQSPEVDACVLGEGDNTMVELLDRIAAGVPLAGMSGILLRNPDDGDPLDAGLPNRIPNLRVDDLPRPAWDLFPLENYWKHYPYFGVNRGRTIPILGTRGCPYQCSFCSSAQMWTTKYVTRDPVEVVDEIEHYVNEYGVENVNFVDLTAATNKKWILKLCDELEARAPGITWQLPVGTRSEALDADVLKRLWDTGCRNISICPESGSERMLEIYKKRVKLPHILESIRSAREVGIWTVVHIIIGHPDETWPDVWKSAKFLVRAALQGCSDAAVIMFCPYPGSEDFKRLVAEGVLEIDEESFYVGLLRSTPSSRSWNTRMSSKQLWLLQLGMLGLFYSIAMIRRPRRIFDFFKAQFSSREETYLDQIIRTKRRNAPTVIHNSEPSKISA